MAMKKGAKIAIIIISIVLVLAIAAGVCVFLFLKNEPANSEGKDRGFIGNITSLFSKEKKEEEINVEFSYENEDTFDFQAGNTSIAENFTQVYIDWAYGDVIIESYDGDDYRIEEDGDDKLSDNEKLQWYKDGQTLYVNYRTSGKKTYKGKIDGKTLHFYVPNSRMSTSLLLDVWTVTADISAKNLKIGDIDTVTDSGKSTFRNMDVYTSSFESNTGEIDLELVNYNNIDVISKSGKITIYSPEDKGFCLEYDGVKEKLTSEFKFDPEIKSGGGVYIDEKMIIRLTNESGNTTVKKLSAKKK